MQEAIMVITEVVPERLESLVEVLRGIGDDITGNPHMAFSQIPRLHFCSFFVAGQSSERPTLIFEGNIDGDVRQFLRQFVSQARSGLDQIYRHCRAYPTPDQDDIWVVEYLMANSKIVNTFFVGLPGMTLERIQQESDLRDKIQTYLDQADMSQCSAAEIRKSIQQFVRGEPSLDWALGKVPGEPFVVRHGPTIIKLSIAAVIALILATIIAGVVIPDFGIAVGVAFILLAAFAVWFVFRFRRLEETDPEADGVEVVRPVSGVSRREDQQDLNHLANVAPIKPGWIRLTVLRSVLWAVDLFGRYVYTKGELGGTATIHFARWMITNSNKDLIFLSNYDGSWENYLGDFVDKSSTGLTAIWSNTIEFPKTSWLVRGGASKEQPFKAAARRRQVASLVWYSAYPSLTIKNIQNNKAIRKDLFAELDEGQVAAWLRRF